MKNKHKPAHPATKLIYLAVKAKLIERRQECELCGGARRIEAHHDDYTRPYEVRWLCHRCHMRHHASLVPRPQATCGHGIAEALGLCRNCYEKQLRRRNPGFAERQRQNCRRWTEKRKCQKAQT